MKKILVLVFICTAVPMTSFGESCGEGAAESYVRDCTCSYQTTPLMTVRKVRVFLSDEEFQKQKTEVANYCDEAMEAAESYCSGVGGTTPELYISQSGTKKSKKKVYCFVKYKCRYRGRRVVTNQNGNTYYYCDYRRAPLADL